MPRVRVGVLGCGMIAQLMHLPYLSELSDRFEVVAVCDLQADLAHRIAAQFDIPAVYDNFERMLDDGLELDAVLVLNSDHYAPVKAALGRGLHTFTEKPLCHTIAEAEELVALSEDSGAKLMVGYMKRYDSGVRQALEEIRSTRNPRLAAMHVVVGPDHGNWIIPELRWIDRPWNPEPSGPDDRTRRVREELGTVATPLLSAYMEMFGVWSHDLNILRHAFPGFPVEIHTEVSGNGTSLSAILRYSNGLQCVFQGTSTRVHQFEESLTVWGEDRMVEVNISNPFLRHAPTTTRIREDTPTDSSSAPCPALVDRVLTGDHDEAFRKQLIHFHDCVVHPSLRPETDGREALEDTRLMAAVVRKAAK